MEDSSEGDEQSRLLNLPLDAWVKRVKKEETKRAKSNHTFKMMLDKEQRMKLVNCTRAKVARDLKRQSLQNALPITVSGDCERAAIWPLDECEVVCQTIRMQAIPARIGCDWVGEEVLKAYVNLAHNRKLQGGDRSVQQVAQNLMGKP